MLTYVWRNKQEEIQRFLLRLVNDKDLPAIKISKERRQERRINLCLAVWVLPLNDNCPNTEGAFTAITKDFSSAGLTVVTNQPISAREVLLRLPSEVDSRLLRARVSNCTTLGCGWFVFGMKILELTDVNEYPQLGHFQDFLPPLGQRRGEHHRELAGHR